MAAPLFDQTYNYRFASALVAANDSPSRLTLAPSSPPAQGRVFFDGRLHNAEIAASLLLATSDVALRRFYFPPGMVAKILREADPVVTVAAGRLRFESFSQCCGVYARTDMLDAAFETDVAGKGTTNVDFNPPMRAALSKVRDRDAMGLSVIPEGVEVRTDSAQVFERKVTLPVRWLKGFAEVQSHAARLQHAMTLNGPEARRFLASLPSQVKARDGATLLPLGKGVRISQQRRDDGVAVSGLGRLRVMQKLARHATELRIYTGAYGTSGFELDFGASRFLIVLSAEPSRGFSGEGQMLASLAAGDIDATISRVRAKLNWDQLLEPAKLAEDLNAARADVDAALAVLASNGLLGFDPHESAYFARELPFDLSNIDDLHPRLKDAKALFEDGMVRVVSSKAGTEEAVVSSNGTEHRTRQGANGWRCTCQWFGKTAGEQGPCKHVLAAMMATGTRT